MNRKMKLAWILISSCIFSHNSKADKTAQEIVDLFFSTHSVHSSKIYCRTDILTSECRTLIRFKSNARSELVEGFQISFFAPSRQSVGTELFLPTTDGGSGYMQQYVDKSFDGKFVAELGDVLPVKIRYGQILISNWRPAPNISAQLKFEKSLTAIHGTITKPDGTTELLKLKYKLFTSRRW